MASTSSTNAAAEPRTTSDDERGTGFFFGKAALTLVTFGLAFAAVVSSPRRAPVRAHASGRP